MPFKLTNVVIHGFIHKNNSAKSKRRRVELKFFENKLAVSSCSYNISVANNIRFLLVKCNFYQEVKKVLEQEFQESLQISAKITNFVQHISINANKIKTLKTVIPALHSRFGIESAGIVQEPSCTEPMSAQALLNLNKDTNYLKLKLELFSKTVTVTIIHRKDKIRTHVSIIMTDWKILNRRLLEFFAEYED